jgi:transcriptional regulator NrdR family protein
MTELPDEPIERRRPCPCCGSCKRTAHVSIVETVHIDVRLKTHSKHRFGGRKVLREVWAGEDFYRKEGIWVSMHRVIDRVKDWYEETFKAPDGRIIHHTAERLSDHTGHGDDRRKHQRAHSLT